MKDKKRSNLNAGWPEIKPRHIPSSISPSNTPTSCKVRTITVYSRSGADPFRPHEFKPSHELITPPAQPSVLLLPEVDADILAISRESSYDEIGWLGTVKELEDRRFLIDSVHMFEQEVDGASCDIPEESLGNFFYEFLQKDPDTCSRFLFWGHLHPGNYTQPSPQDNKQMEGLFSKNDYFIRGIFGRGGRAEYTIYDYVRNIIWHDVPWEVFQPDDRDRRERWAAEIAAKVRKKFVQPAAPVKQAPPPAGRRRWWWGLRNSEASRSGACIYSPECGEDFEHAPEKDAPLDKGREGLEGFFEC